MILIFVAYLFPTSVFQAYDIGFGGLDHVEAFEANDVNVLVVDTEMYSNTGGQQSKATPAGAMAQFASGGKVQRKKDIGQIFMTYEHVYVASICLANQAQMLQALVEADRHPGPSIVIAYAPCIQQGVRPQGLNDMFDEAKFAIDSGYWPLYRYNPSLLAEGQNPFILDSKKLRKDVASFLQRESRFINLKKKNPEVAKELWEHMNQDGTFSTIFAVHCTTMLPNGSLTNIVSVCSSPPYGSFVTASGRLQGLRPSRRCQVSHPLRFRDWYSCTSSP